MATPTRLANKTIDSLELATDVLTGIVTDARQGRFEENRYPKYR